MSVFIGYPSFMAYQMMKGKKGNNDGFPSIPGMIARYSALGLTNEEMSKTPVWKDLTGNGYDLQMKNFAWGGMSGVDGYKFNFLANEWVIDNNQSKKYSYKIVINNKQNIIQLCNRINLGHIKITLKITGIEINKSTFRVYDNAGTEHAQYYTKDGIYEIDYTSNEGANIIYFYVFGGNMGQLENPITIEQLPLYPDALVFDGVDDYGTCDNFPILTKEKGYTVVALRQFISDKISSLLSKWTIAGETGAFIFEGQSAAGSKFSSSFGHNFYGLEKTILSYMTSTSYNGNTIVPGDKKDTNNNLVVGRFYSDLNTHYVNAAIWEIVILDHDATEEELTKIKDYFVKTYPWLFPNQAWTVVGKTNEDTDRATITNITGNGNNLVLSNFGFSGNSGYGEYAYNWNTWKINKVDSTKSNAYHNRMEITLPAIGESSRTQCNFYSPLCEVGTIYDFSFKISGLTDNSTVFVKPGTIGGGAIIAQYNKDGVYHLNYTLTDEAIVNESTQNRIYFFIQNFSDEEMNLTIEQIPDHEGYLVTDGVDDKIFSSAFRIDKKFTVLGEWKFLNNVNVASGIVKPNSFFIYNAITGTQLFLNSTMNVKVYPTKSLKAFCSDGRVYDSNWVEYLQGEEQTIDSSVGPLILGINGDKYAQLALKNIAIFNGKYLSKEDMIKAYIYLQTLKAK